MECIDAIDEFIDRELARSQAHGQIWQPDRENQRLKRRREAIYHNPSESSTAPKSSVQAATPIAADAAQTPVIAGSDWSKSAWSRGERYNCCDVRPIIISCTSHCHSCEAGLAIEDRTARLTILIDPRKKELFERLCAEEDATSSQVVRRLVRRYIEERTGKPWIPPEEKEARSAPRRSSPRRRSAVR